MIRYLFTIIAPTIIPIEKSLGSKPKCLELRLRTVLIMYGNGTVTANPRKLSEIKIRNVFLSFPCPLSKSIPPLYL